MFSFKRHERFCCSNHPDVEAAVFCETCSAMQGCTGYWCKDCDNYMHAFFPGHQRVTPKHIEKSKMCDKHPGHSAEEIYCWETKTLRCSMCACEEGVRGCTIPVAIDNIIRDAEKDCEQINSSIKKLSESRDTVAFELNDERNPKNLETQMRDAKEKAQAAFNQLRQALDQRERTVLEKIEETFTSRTSTLSEQARELGDVIEAGKEIIESYKTLSTATKDAILLKKLLKLKGETENVTALNRKCDASPVVSVAIEFVFKEKDDIIQQISSYGKVIEGINLPAPSNFRSTKTKWNSIDLAWDPVSTSSFVTYKVMAKKKSDAEDKWRACYNGQEAMCKCENLDQGTDYMFKLFTSYKGTESLSIVTCSARTVNVYKTIFIS